MRWVYYLAALLFVSITAAGQEINIDETLASARSEAEQGRYDKALSLIDPLLKKYPENEDIKTFSGRIYSWKKEYKTAIQTLSPMADRVNPNPDALLAITNVYYWTEDFEKCISYCDRYLAVDATNVDVLKIKVACLEKLDRDKEALEIIEKASVNENSTQAFKALRTLIDRKTKNAVSVSYLNISTSNPGQAPLHYGYVEYTRKFSKSALVGRANMGHIGNDTQALFEADYYQTFSKKDYLYVNGGVSTGETIFPVAKFGAEYYFRPQKRFDYALGARYMHFETDDVTLLTVQISYKTGANTIAYRPYYDTGNALFSHVLSFQHTNEEKERVIRFEVQYGNVPYLYLYSNFVQPLKAYRAGVQYQQRLGNSFFVRPIFLYEYEEYLPNEYRNRFNAQIIITKRF